jgi:hypothetical protein|tara:strand:- start:5228 stop:5563 length:336 start_codon:yes stop_codon:yes gene_type:complete
MTDKNQILIDALNDIANWKPEALPNNSGLRDPQDALDDVIYMGAAESIADDARAALAEYKAAGLRDLIGLQFRAELMARAPHAYAGMDIAALILEQAAMIREINNNIGEPK